MPSIAFPSSLLEAALPWGAQALACAALVVGLVLWVRGRTFLKLLYALAFAAAVGALGFFAPVSLGLEINPHIGLAAGALLGVLVGLVAFKFSMAATLALVLATVAPIAASVALTFTPAPISEENAQAAAANLDAAHQQLKEQVDEANRAFTAASNYASDNYETPSVPGVTDDERDTAIEIAQSAAESVRDFVTQLLRDASTRLQNMTVAQRVTVLGSAVLAAAVGMLLGLVFSNRAAAVASAFVGAALWLPAAVYLLDYTGVSAARALPSTASGWLVGWLAISALGAALQWTRRKPHADNPPAD